MIQAITLLVIAALVAIDQVIKIAVVNRFAAGGSMDILFGLIRIRYVENTGAAFSALSGSGLLLILLTAALIIAAIVWYLRHGDCNRWLAAGVTLIVAGGLGNLYDRLTLGYVIDFIEVLFVRFAIFNVADVAVVCGTVCLIIGILKTEGKAR